MNEQTQEYLKKQTAYMKVTAVCAVIILVVTLCATGFLCIRMQSLYQRSSRALDNIESITKDLEKVDFKGLSESITSLSAGSTDALDAIGKLKDIDVDELNRGIKAFSDTVSPLAGLVGGFRR
jgi:hypothetical protein